MCFYYFPVIYLCSKAMLADPFGQQGLHIKEKQEARSQKRGAMCIAKC